MRRLFQAEVKVAKPRQSKAGAAKFDDPQMILLRLRAGTLVDVETSIVAYPDDYDVARRYARGWQSEHAVMHKRRQPDRRTLGTFGPPAATNSAQVAAASIAEWCAAICVDRPPSGGLG